MAAEIRIGGVAVGHEAVAANIAVRDWLETQARVAAYWRDILVDHNGDLALIEALDAHEQFLMDSLR